MTLAGGATLCCGIPSRAAQRRMPVSDTPKATTIPLHRRVLRRKA